MPLQTEPIPVCKRMTQGLYVEIDFIFIGKQLLKTQILNNTQSPDPLQTFQDIVMASS